MKLIKLTIKGISHSQTQSGAYALVLSEIEGIRTLPVIIGTFEAESIAIALEKEIRPPRPLTHNLFKTFAGRFSIILKQVIIHKLEEGVFYSSLTFEKNGVVENIDSRTSDAIALAVRFQAPIFIHEDILDKAGIFLEINEELIESDEIDFDLEEADYSHLSLIELKERLNQAVIDEKYELAAKIHDQISKRT